MTFASRGRAAFVLTLVLAAIFAAYLAVLSDGMPAAATDWAMYVMHTHNILTGRPYADTGYVFQPEAAFMGPQSYPSGYPLMLAPVYAVFGFHIRAFKVLSDLALVLSLWPLYVLCRRVLPLPYAICIIVATGFGYEYIGIQNTVNSDAPYQLLSFLGLVLMQWIYDRGKDAGRQWRWGAVAGIVLSVAYLTRPIGLALILAVILSTVFRQRRLSFFLAALVSVFVLAALLNNTLFHRDSAYNDQFIFSAAAIVQKAVTYLGYLSHAFANPWSNRLRYLLWSVSVPLVLVGIPINIRRRGNMLLEIYTLILVGVLCIYILPNTRYLAPILPLYLSYAALGWEAVLERIPNAYRTASQTVAAAALLLPAAINLAYLPSIEQDTFVARPAFEQLCKEIQKEVGPHEYILFWNPRVLALYTNRAASAYPLADAPEVERYLNRIRPNYVVLDKHWDDDHHYLAPVVESQPQQYVAVFENERYKLERISDAPDRRSAQPAPIP